MRDKLKYSFFIALTLLLLTLSTPLSVHAQTAASEGINLQVSPLPIELSTKPGTSVSADLRVRNISSHTEKLQIRLLKVSEDDNGLVHLAQTTPNDEITKWVSFSRNVFDAPSNQWQTIKMTINVPSGAAFGYYFAVEYLRDTQEAPQAGKAVARGAVATFILLNADAPGANREAQVVSFIADRKSYEFLPVSFNVKVRSTGNVHVAPTGNIFISKGGKQVGIVNLNSAQGNILPHSSRFFSTTWSDGFPVYTIKSKDGQPVLNKKGLPEKSLKWDFSHANRLRFGHYTAHLVMVYDNGSRDVPIEGSLSFWVIPWRVIGGVIFMGAGIPFFAALYIRSRRRVKKLELELSKHRGNS